MFSRAIEWSVRSNVVVIAAGILLLAAGGYATMTMPVDVFPDLTAPTVTVLTEAHGLAAEEVEQLVTFPIETAVTGATGVRRVRSSSAMGISIVWVEFDWGTDIYQARQIVNEKLQLAAASLADDAEPPVMGPITSIMGEILLIGMRSDSIDAMELRALADWTVRRRLLSIPGVAQVVPLGGEVKQYQVQVDPDRLRTYDLDIDEVADAVAAANDSGSGSFLVHRSQELPVRALGRIHSVDELGGSVVRRREAGSILVRDLGEAMIGAAPSIGAGSVDGRPAVILSVQKQPGADTLALTERIDAELDLLQESLGAQVVFDRQIFRQSEFITVAVDNVVAALRDGGILAVVVLVVFLMSWRTTLISALAIPLSLMATVLVLWGAGISINTMTLGGMAIAIGALVDDAVIGVENIYKRLRQAVVAGDDEVSAATTVIAATREVVVPIVFATFVVIVVFLPLFFLSGVEGRLLQPLGIAYVTAILASLVVSLTITPALSLLLLPRAAQRRIAEPPVVRWAQAMYHPVLVAVLRWPRTVVMAGVLAFAAAAALTPFFGRTFLPEFNEGTLVVNAVSLPGTSLEEADVLGRMVEQIALAQPEVVATSRRTGRAEMSEHAQGSNESEIDVIYELVDRDRDEFLGALRTAFLLVPGTNISIGQPIGHRIDHMISGTRAAIAVKLFGPELPRLRQVAEEIKTAIEGVPGLVDLQVEQQSNIPQLQIVLDRQAMTLHGARAREVLHQVEAAVGGRVVGEIREGERAFDLVVRFGSGFRDAPALLDAIPVRVDRGTVSLGQLATVREDRGPNLINRENGQRKIVVSANVADRDIGSVVEDIQAAVAGNVVLPPDYFVQFGGQFESQQRAARLISIASVVSLCAIALLLFLAFGDGRAAGIVMLSVPLSMIGGVATVQATGGVLSIASLVGFITLFGIATRNGILLVASYRDLAAQGLSSTEAALRGSSERLAPILMTALTTGLALIPLALQAGEPGNEIQSPLAQVVLGGLLTSTLLTLLLLPAAYKLFGRARAE